MGVGVVCVLGMRMVSFQPRDAQGSGLSKNSATGERIVMRSRRKETKSLKQMLTCFPRGKS